MLYPKQADAPIPSSEPWGAEHPDNCCHVAYDSIHVQPGIIFLRHSPLTTPPTPNAGMILPILAKLLTSQSLVTLVNRCENPKTPCLLYRSRPNRCIGVENNCVTAGARNCTALSLFCSVSNRWASCVGSSANFGASRGGKLNEAKIVMLSRTANNA